MEYHLVTKEILLILENYTPTYAKLKGLEISGLREILLMKSNKKQGE